MCIYGCVSVPAIPARGAVAGYTLAGTVDSALAQDYLEGRPLPADLDAIRDHFLDAARSPSREELHALSRRFSPDVATLLFIETIDALPKNRRFRARLQREVDFVRRVGLDAARPSASDVRVLFIPGWFYIAHGARTGADLARQRRLLDRLGVANRLVAVDENGTVAENAKIVAEAIRNEPRGGRLLLVSASKGGPEVAMALGAELSAAESERVIGWLSIGGALRGSPFADRVLAPDLCWLAKLKFAAGGHDLDGAKSLKTARARARFNSLHIPARIPIVSYVAVPLSGQVTKRGAFGYARLRHHGPNDGMTLLADELVPGATVLLAPNTDHFFQYEKQDLHSAALFRVLIADELPATQNRQPPNN